MADAYECLGSLRMLLQSKREEAKERLGRGKFEGEDGYREWVGRSKAWAEAIDLVSQQIKSINGGEDDDDGKKGAAQYT